MALTGFNNPNLAAGATNELTQSEEARKKGQLGLESAYFAPPETPPRSPS